MKFMFGSALVLLSLFSGSCRAEGPIYEPMIPYSFGYTTSDGMSRTESGHGNVVQGSYSYIDANGDTRHVRYTADAHGYHPEGDISVDRKTAAAAAALAAIAPKAPLPVPVAAAPAHQWAPPPAPAAPAAAYQARSYNSWAPAPAAPVPSWASAAGSTSYQVETPTHKIWVKY
ncbi:hypothetical protein TYRP_015284 [Tyrophagus putrescentiae]|nr:hypothetical protein TYRP_015284 [Tyrophagus putrescentiae]